jgi:hypothetical protein
MGNFLSFLDIYNLTYMAVQNDDYLTVSYELSRLFRRIFDFSPMYRAPLQENLAHPPPMVESNSLNNVTKFIAAVTGFFWGGFDAPSSLNCKRAANVFYYTSLDYAWAVKTENKDRQLWYATRMLQDLHPFVFNCYYAGKQSTLVAIKYYN